jgi:hypothetical protein
VKVQSKKLKAESSKREAKCETLKAESEKQYAEGN